MGFIIFFVLPLVYSSVLKKHFLVTTVLYFCTKDPCTIFFYKTVIMIYNTNFIILMYKESQIAMLAGI